MDAPYSKSERAIIILMRLFGVGGMLAIPAIFLPWSWMNAIHAWMGLGELPDIPIVSYLTRSLSAFYAMLGCMTLYVSVDIRRHRGLVRMWSILLTLFGALMLGVDLTSGMPAHWTWTEGPPTMAAGLAMLSLQRRIRVPDSEATATP